MEKKYNPKESQRRIRNLWEEKEVYKTPHVDSLGELYSVDTPPPTVSGSLHIGHIFSYTQTDIAARYKRMSGHKVFYPFGFDNNGLPTEKFVEKVRKIRPSEMERSQFVQICLEETAKAQARFRELWGAIGLSVDWTKSYSTISPEVQKISQASFLRLFRDGFAYKNDAPALYCPTCRTTVAQAELEDKDLPSVLNYIEFKTADGQPLIIATTRPELLGACVSIFFHPDDPRYAHLRGKEAIVPLYDLKVPILPNTDVEIEKGSGLVMCCTYGDKADVEWQRKFGLETKIIIGRNGKFLDSTSFVAGLKVPRAREAIIVELQQRNLIKEQKKITHAVNLHERCKQPIEYTLMPQWFIKIVDLKDKFLELGNQIEWHPGYMHARYNDWVGNISWDWCISRQRFYGIPFPIWYCKKCGKIIAADESELPIDPFTTTPKADKCPNCGCTELRPDTDVMDTWNTSSLTPYICLNMLSEGPESPLDIGIKSRFIPMSHRASAHDIIRTWAFYTIVKTHFHSNSIPWSKMVIAGHVLAGRGDKLSKSQSNANLSPEALIERYSADAVRYWTAGGALGKDITLSEDEFKAGGKLANKIWNSFRFLSAHVPAKYFRGNTTAGNAKHPFNSWILEKCNHCFEIYSRNLDDYEHYVALNALERFFWHDLCDNYLEIIKDILFNSANYDPTLVEETKQTAGTVSFLTLQMFAPYLPYVTEGIYQQLDLQNYVPTNPISIHMSQFEAPPKQPDRPYTLAQLELLVDVVREVRKLKTGQRLALNYPIEKLTIGCPANLIPLMNEAKQTIAGVTAARNIEIEVGTLEVEEVTAKINSEEPLEISIEIPVERAKE